MNDQEKNQHQVQVQSKQQEKKEKEELPFKIKFHIFISPEFNLDKKECQIGIFTNLSKKKFDMKDIIVFDNIR